MRKNETKKVLKMKEDSMRKAAENAENKQISPKE
jgi:hypothetical protein